MSTRIPDTARAMVQVRDGMICCWCGVPTSQGQWHHRRSRSVDDKHRHCTCNGVWLCHLCHSWMHAHPFEARGQGYIVSRNEAQPGQVPLFVRRMGYVALDCNGNYIRIEEEQ